MNWYIGQKIVAVKDWPETGFFKKGDPLIIQGVVQCPKCGRVSLSVGFSLQTADKQVCGNGEHFTLAKRGDRYWHNSAFFAPIEPAQELSTHTTETLIEELDKQLQTV